MSTIRITLVQPGHLIQLPAEWAEALGLRSVAALEKTAEGIVVRPWPALTWDQVFASKLAIGRRPPADEGFEGSGDDFLL
jgi:hypothetical protein